MTVDERDLNKYPKSITFEVFEIIRKQMKNSICKICLKNGIKGTGFLCIIPFPDQNTVLKILVTNNHIINQEYLDKEEIINAIFDNNKVKIIKLKNKKKYTNKDYDITIIEINEKDEIKEDAFLEIDDNIIIDKSYYGYIGNTIYILHYPSIGNEQKLSISLGIIKENSFDKEYEFKHLCSTGFGSSGSPIISASNNKVIGIHKKARLDENCNIGAFLNYAIIDYKKLFKKEISPKNIKDPNNIEKVNKVNKGKENEVNKLNTIINVDSLNNVVIKYKINKNNKIKIFGDDFVKSNINNCNFIFNEREMKLVSYLNLDINEIKNDFIEIILKSTKNITNMSYLFSGCNSLSSKSDFSNWNTCNVTNMSYMFFGCESLEYLPDISFFNTNNVKDMSFMFSGCRALKNIPDISKWNTSNVINMSNMFSYCSSLNSLPKNISKWNINKVNDLKCMFYECSKLESLPDISLWNVINVRDMSYMFCNCKELQILPELKRWEIQIQKTTKIIGVFYGCSIFLNVPKIFKEKNKSFA